jgi:MOSC domain-containing protein YiiM
MSLYIGAEDLEAGLPAILAAPADTGTVELVVRRPAEGEREVLEEGILDTEQGLVGDDWQARSARKGQTDDPDTQLTLMSARVIDLVAGSRDRWPLAGDQLYVDLDLSTENLPPGTRLQVGSALLEVTAELHTGCAKFTERFGPAAIRFVNGKAGRPHRLRGMYARVVEPGVVRPGDAISKL